MIVSSVLALAFVGYGYTHSGGSALAVCERVCDGGGRGGPGHLVCGGQLALDHPVVAGR